MNEFNYKIIYKNILNSTVNSYLNQSKIHGLTPKGIHWQSHLTQNARFENLLNIVLKKDYNREFKISDFGCGYGEFYNFIKQYSFMTRCSYIGYDIVQKFIKNAKLSYPNGEFICSDKILKKTDYTIISGTFNLASNYSPDIWENYLYKSLEDCFSKTLRGVAFNLLMANETKVEKNLFYTTPEKISVFCKKFGETIVIKTKGIKKDMSIFVYK